MTFQARSLLKELKKHQKTEDASVFINFTSLDIKQVRYDDEESICGNIKKFEGSVLSLLEYLEHLGYITHDKHGIVKVLHAGWHTKQDAIDKLITFMLRSILIPILLSIATSVIAFIVERLLTNPT